MPRSAASLPRHAAAAVAASPRPRRDWILVTGPPGCGKTTAVQRLSQALQGAGIPVQGFVTQEVRSSDGPRSGFDIVTVPDGRRGPLARKQGLPSTWPSTGAYRVDVSSIDRVAVPTLSIPAAASATTSTQKEDIGSPMSTIFVLDEIGRMELHSTKFCEAVQTLLNQTDECIRLVGAVTAPRYGHRVPFCDHVTAHDGVQVHNLTKKTRDQVTEDLLDYIQTHWIDEYKNAKAE